MPQLLDNSKHLLTKVTLKIGSHCCGQRNDGCNLAADQLYLPESGLLCSLAKSTTRIYRN